VEVLHDLMHSLHIEKYYIVGHSMGGYIGLAFANYYVNHVIGLTLVHSTSFEDNTAKKEIRLKESVDCLRGNRFYCQTLEF
jgi:pimeloyl-ACP methyl ester carboxylesterase